MERHKRWPSGHNPVHLTDRGVMGCTCLEWASVAEESVERWDEFYEHIEEVRKDAQAQPRRD